MKTAMVLIAGIVIGAAAVWTVMSSNEMFPSDAVESEIDHDDDDDDGDEANEYSSRVVVVDGETRIVLTAAEIAYAGIEIAELSTIEFQPFERARAAVMDGRKLIDQWRMTARQRDVVQQQRALVAVVDAQLQTMRQAASQRALGASGKLAALEREYARTKAELSGARTRLSELETALHANWGLSVVDKLASDAELREGLATGAQHLIALQFRSERLAKQSRVNLQTPDATGGQARFIGLTRKTLELGRPEPTFLFAVDKPDLSPGQLIFVQLESASTNAQSRLLPDRAIVWHAGQQWYFAPRSETEFVRFPLPDSFVVSGGVALRNALQHPVVVSGAQALLAEEFRGSIPIEDDD